MRLKNLLGLEKKKIIRNMRSKLKRLIRNDMKASNTGKEAEKEEQSQDIGEEKFQRSGISDLFDDSQVF